MLISSLTRLGQKKSEKQENGKEDKGRRRRRRKRERREKEGREKRRQKIHETKAAVDDSKSCEYEFILFLFTLILAKYAGYSILKDPNRSAFSFISDIMIKMLRVNGEQSDWLTLEFILRLCDIRLRTAQ